tara:strand:+ start:1777 stop:3798 length:2022 start_codon:yes stop_codon:yes gene_type:complete
VLEPTQPASPDLEDKSSLLDLVKESAQQVAISSVLLAASVAWADGVVQLNEKNKLIEMAKREQELDPNFPFDKVTTWLSKPPSEQEVDAALAVLSQDSKSSEYIVRAQSIAEAHGSLGINAIIGSGIIAFLPVWLVFSLVPGIITGITVATSLKLYSSTNFKGISSEEETVLNWLSESLNEEGYDLQSRIKNSNWKNKIETLRTVMDERSMASRQEKWVPPKDTKPVQCPQYPERMPPSVTDIADSEYQEFRSKIVKRYMQALIGETWSSLEVAHNLPQSLDDELLNDIYWNSPFSRFLTSEFTDNDLTIFQTFFEQKSSEDILYKIDHSHLKDQKTYPGVYIASVIGLFRLIDEGLQVVSISINDKSFTPNQGESWERARLFLLQGSSLSLVGGVHASLHFPTDSVIAITRQYIPENNPIAKIIEAHSYLQLPLNYGVRWSPRSYAHNSPREIYTAFPGPREDVFHGFMTYYEGIEGNSAYPNYQFPLSPPEFPGPYCKALKQYYDVILEFCRTVANQSDLNNLVQWADELNALVPGFPSGKEITDSEILARVLTGYIHSVSVWHYLEHTLYSRLPVHHNPHRIRVEPPTGNDLKTEWWQRTRHTDLFRQEIARRMFYESHTVRNMLEVEYGFENESLIDAAKRFKKGLTKVDKNLPKELQLLHDMACSIQF